MAALQMTLLTPFRNLDSLCETCKGSQFQTFLLGVRILFTRWDLHLLEDRRKVDLKARKAKVARLC